MFPFHSWFAAVAIFSSVAGAAPVDPAGTPSSARVCFYNSETSIDNFDSLKREFDSYFKLHGTLEFNPSPDAKSFESCVAGAHPGLFLVSSWSFQDLQRQIDVEPILVGVSEDRVARRRVLCARKDIESLVALKGKQIATAGSKAFTTAVLEEMLSTEPDVLASVRVLIVPKEIDALMAVGYGMADAALTSEKSLDLLERINPTLAGSLTKLERSGDILLPIVAAERGYGIETEALIEIVEQMGEFPEGEKRLKLIGLDRWRRMGEAERRSLEP